MLRQLMERIRQGHRTMPFPAKDFAMPDRFRGRPLIDGTKCLDGCRACEQACPTGALSLAGDTPEVDLGRCLFCTDCVEACPRGALQHSREFRLAASAREDLVVRGEQRLARALCGPAAGIFTRSLKLRQVSAGGCNACEADTNVLNTVGWDLGRFGIQFVASPRHADGLLVTGPVTKNMELALKKTYEAVPTPKIVIAAGACAISGGPYRGHPESHQGVGDILPVDLYIPGCPPHPATILDGLLRATGRIAAR